MGDVFIPPVNQGRYLGTTNKAGAVWMPRDEGHYYRWKRLVGTIGVGEWGWSPGFPTTSFLRYLWFDPFMMLEKEVTW